MPDQMKNALLQAGVKVEPDADLTPYLRYLSHRCSVGRTKIHSYLNAATTAGTPIALTTLYIVCRAYEHSLDPERDSARALRISVSDIRRLRRKWGIRYGDEWVQHSQTCLTRINSL